MIEKALVTVGERVTRAFIFGVLGGETTEVITVEKTTYMENQPCTRKNQTDPFNKSSYKNCFFSLNNLFSQNNGSPLKAEYCR